MSQPRLLTPEQQDAKYMPHIGEVEKRAEQGYSPRMKFHPWQHALDTREHNRGLRTRMLAAGLRHVPGQFVTEVSALLHDYGLLKYILLEQAGKPPADSAEAYAMETGCALLDELGVDNHTQNQVAEIISGTENGVECDTPGKLSLCLADLWNTGEDFYTGFLIKTEDYRIEREMVEKRKIDPNDFEENSAVFLSNFWFVNLNVPFLLRQFPEARDRREKLANNVFQFLDRQARHRDKKVGVYVANLVQDRGLGALAVKELALDVSKPRTGSI